MPRRTFGIFGGLIALLVVGLAAQFIFQIGRQPSAASLPVEMLPAGLPGVEVKDLPVAETESVSKAVEEGLGFSDYRYREYRSGGMQFAVYLAYWQDRKRHFMDLGTHAPDNCWVSNGWKMDEKLPKRAFALQRPVEDKSLSLNGNGNSQLQGSGSQQSDLQLKLKTSTGVVATGATTWPAEDRVFHAGGSTIYVVYWHLLEGKPLDYTRYGTGKTMGYLVDNISHYWRGTAEQYFLRISSNLPMDQLEKEPAFQAVLASLTAHMPLSPSD
jgi:hypothetical protein